MTSMSDSADATCKPERQEKTNAEHRKGGARAAIVAGWAGTRAGTPGLVRAAAIRLATALVDYVLVLVTALSIIPMVGAYLHQQSGTSLGSPTASGTIAVWLVPFLFVVVVLAVAEIAFMRWLWRVGSARIARIKRARLGGPEAVVAAKPPIAIAQAARKKSTRNRK